MTGEYLVTKGFEGLALPTRLGQWLFVWAFDTPAGQSDFLVYQAKDKQDQVWFETKIDLMTLNPYDSRQEESLAVKRLTQILALVPHEEFIQGKSWRLETKLEFDRKWGLGSSSTFVQLLSDAFRLDPHQVQQTVFGGSGYDVAVAQLRKPMVYWRVGEQPHWKPWTLNPELTKDWMVVFPGQKMDSRKSLSGVTEALDQITRDEFYTQQVQRILELSQHAQEVPQLEASLEMMQMLLSQVTELQTPYQYFNISPIPKGLCKWLGAWGGDMLLVNELMYDEYPDLFDSFISISWNDLVIYE